MPDLIVISPADPQVVVVTSGGSVQVVEVSVASVQVVEVSTQGPSGPTGPTGPTGPAGPTGPVGTDLHYTHTQSIAAATWNVTHNLGKFPSVSIVDSAGTTWISDVNYLNVNSLTITFAAAFGGYAYMN